MQSALAALHAMRTLVRLEVATVGLVGMAMLAAQDPDIGGSVCLALPASALQEHLAMAISLADLDSV